jgi:hypothetical protein
VIDFKDPHYSAQTSHTALKLLFSISKSVALGYINLAPKGLENFYDFQSPRALPLAILVSHQRGFKKILIFNIQGRCPWFYNIT